MVSSSGSRLGVTYLPLRESRGQSNPWPSPCIWVTGPYQVDEFLQRRHISATTVAMLLRHGTTTPTPSAFSGAAPSIRSSGKPSALAKVSTVGRPGFWAGPLLPASMLLLPTTLSLVESLD